MVEEEQVQEALKQVEDPELKMDVWSLGLIYEIEIDDDEDQVDIEMTFTTPMCPYGPELVDDVETTILEETSIEHVEVEVTFDPPWEPPEDLRAMMGR